LDERAIVADTTTTIYRNVLGKEIAGLHSQGAGDLKEKQHPEIPHAALHAGLIRSINADDVSQMFLAPVEFFATFPNPISDFLQMRITRTLAGAGRHAPMLV
jgi:hypothetical protein